MSLINLLASFHNWISDKDFIWWPFSFLRPEKNELITLRHVGLMTLCFGGLAFLMFAGFAVVNNVMTADNLIITFISCFLSFFLWFGLVTRPLWNLRARDLRQKK